MHEQVRDVPALLIRAGDEDLPSRIAHRDRPSGRGGELGERGGGEREADRGGHRDEGQKSAKQQRALPSVVRKENVADCCHRVSSTAATACPAMPRYSSETLSCCASSTPSDCGSSSQTLSVTGVSCEPPSSNACVCQSAGYPKASSELAVAPPSPSAL